MREPRTCSCSTPSCSTPPGVGARVAVRGHQHLTALHEAIQQAFVGARIACLFDFGDEWRVALTLQELAEPDQEPYPRVLCRTGTAPPQYA